ncbi:DUF357 domain-containing protein [Candidatus Micrarchaeota archaeon]|nr:DUF357 domain-containing protein [Candidatus Micrarchaeota archaeon]
MEPRERAKKDMDKLGRMIARFRELGLAEKYPGIIGYADNYFADARHFYAEGDYFTAFGAANYAYGFIDAVLVIEGRKEEALSP